MTAREMVADLLYSAGEVKRIATAAREHLARRWFWMGPGKVKCAGCGTYVVWTAISDTTKQGRCGCPSA